MSALTGSVRVGRAIAATAAGFTTPIEGSSIDLGADGGYEGCMFIIGFGTLTATQVTAVHVETSSDNSTWNDLEGSDSGALADDDDDEYVIIDVYKPMEQYLRAVVTRGTANAVITDGIAILYRGGDRPSTLALSDVALSEVLVSPDEGTK